MSIKRIVVHVDCDACGIGFRVDMDESTHHFPPGWSVMDIAEDAIRGSIDYQDSRGAPGNCSVQDGQHLCHQCTQMAYLLTESAEPVEEVGRL